jgi:hypothetical protein
MHVIITNSIENAYETHTFWTHINLITWIEINYSNSI